MNAGDSKNRQNKNNKWVCPNDRQLALRAKLQTGWSVKSESLDYQRSDYNLRSPISSSDRFYSNSSNSCSRTILSNEERERIIEVIGRAQALDSSEQERVGKLQDRLDNIKRNVTHVTSTRMNKKRCGTRCTRGNKCVCSCALCTEKFSLLGTGPSTCEDCRNYVCEKCCIETITMPLLKSPQKHQHYSTKKISFDLPRSSESIENINSTKSQNASRAVNKVYLCRVCTETREVWKKSGAWFFKSAPKCVIRGQKA